jgi:thiamine biosynthesis lipoprotein
VDVLARYLESRGIFSYLVEIGGEVRAGAPKPNGDKWIIGVDKPDEANLSRNLALSIGLENLSLATSGNYRKFVEINGLKLGHTLNPITGFPATTDVLSSTIIADDCMTADALATACLALGFEKAKSLVEAESGVEAIFIYSDGEEVKTWVSAGAQGWIVKEIKR